MNGVTIGRRFDVGAYPLRRVISIAKDGLVLAHVNASNAIPDAERTATMLAASFDMAEALRSVANLLDQSPAIGARVSEASAELALSITRAALAKAGVV